MLIAFEGLAQRVHPTVQTEKEKREMYRKEIGLDYSVPDFFVNKIDEEKMGKRNAAILRSLEENYKQRQYNQVLATILYEQQNINKVSVMEITKIKILSVSKQDNEISIKIRTWQEPKDIVGKQSEITLCFVNGVSESAAVNSLFSSIGHYVKAKELSGDNLRWVYITKYGNKYVIHDKAWKRILI